MGLDQVVGSRVLNGHSVCQGENPLPFWAPFSAPPPRALPALPWARGGLRERWSVGEEDRDAVSVLGASGGECASSSRGQKHPPPPRPSPCCLPPD